MNCSCAFLGDKIGFKFLFNKVKRLKKLTKKNITKMIVKPILVVVAQPCGIKT
jgi:hypothetical protein